MTKTRSIRFSRKRRQGGRKTVKRRGGRKRSRVTKRRGGRRRSRVTKRRGGRRRSRRRRGGRRPETGTSDAISDWLAGAGDTIGRCWNDGC